MTARSIHYISGLMMCVFIALHLDNHMWSISGAEKHIEVMRMLRRFYRNLFVEAALLYAVVVQIISAGVTFRPVTRY